ncbi:hypothetical protein L3X38_015353 [Prunus dulcis]|uniref:Uncharacterized protein n=1 Tax=Prunus dulcis TaxID=3755 RepID=A0AAD4WQ56_PRUDU|nr:hypothetical protein L3X38_015353 [Prunus dulcis]
MLVSSKVEENRTTGSLAMVTSPLKPPIIPIHSVLGSSTTTSFADPELAKFEAMDLDAQLDRLEKLGATPSKAKSRAMDEAMERVRIWQSTELDLDKNKEAVDQLMQDLDLLHSENMTPRAILERSLHRTSLTYSHCITTHYTIYIFKKNAPMHRCHVSNNTSPRTLETSGQNLCGGDDAVMIARYWKNAWEKVCAGRMFEIGHVLENILFNIE